MTYHEERQELDAQTIILGLGYATALLTILGWIATAIIQDSNRHAPELSQGTTSSLASPTA